LTLFPLHGTADYCIIYWCSGVTGKSDS